MTQTLSLYLCEIKKEEALHFLQYSAASCILSFYLNFWKHLCCGLRLYINKNIEYIF